MAQRFHIQKIVVGKGKFAVVRRAVDLEDDNKVVAVKEMQTSENY